MTRPKWTDETSYSRNESPRYPRVWEMKLPGDHALCVHRLVGAKPETWFFSMALRRQRVIDRHELKAIDPDKAKLEAIDRARQYLSQLREDITQGLRALREY